MIAGAVVLILFSDSAWMPSTETLMREWRRWQPTGRILLHLWLENNGALLPRACASAGVECRILGPQTTHFDKLGARMPAILDEVRRTDVDEDLVVLDSDVVLRRNVAAWMPRLEPNKSLVFQQERPCQTAPKRLCVNGGVWWARRSPETTMLLTQTLELMHRLRLPDQDALQIVAARNARSVGFLPPDRYPNGFVYFHELGGQTAWHLFHANWLSSRPCKLLVLERVRRALEFPRTSLPDNCTLF